MKQFQFVALFLFFATSIQAQVGIQTTDPKATLDIVGNGANTLEADGVLLPRVTRQNLTNKAAATYGALQTGTIIYVTDITGGTNAETLNITAIGYYYHDGAAWQKLDNDTLENIYTTNGTLQGNRTVEFDGKNLNLNVATDLSSQLQFVGNRLQLGVRGSNANFSSVGSLELNFASENNSNAANIFRIGAGGNPSEGTYAEYMRVARNGNVGISTSNPQAKLHVAGTARITNTPQQSNETNTAPQHIMVVDADGDVNESEYNIYNGLPRSKYANMRRDIANGTLVATIEINPQFELRVVKTSGSGLSNPRRYSATIRRKAAGGRQQATITTNIMGGAGSGLHTSRSYTKSINNFTNIGDEESLTGTYEPMLNVGTRSDADAFEGLVTHFTWRTGTFDYDMWRITVMNTYLINSGEGGIYIVVEKLEP